MYYKIDAMRPSGNHFSMRNNETHSVHDVRNLEVQGHGKTMLMTTHGPESLGRRSLALT